MDFLPKLRPSRVLNRPQPAEIVYTLRQSGIVRWRCPFLTQNPIPHPPVDLPDRDYTVSITWREDWRVPDAP